MLTLLFISSFSFAQKTSHISNISIKNPIEYFLAANANWQAEIEIYFNSKVLLEDIPNYKLGMYEAFKACGEEYCFRFSLEQQNLTNYRWYPSAIGIDADVARSIYLGLKRIGLPETLGFGLIYIFYFALSFWSVLILYGRLIVRVQSKLRRTVLQVLLFTPWILFTTMSISFSLFIRFAPLFIYLYLIKKDNFLIDVSNVKFSIPIFLSILISTLHGYEFLLFVFALTFLLPSPKDISFISWLKFWTKHFCTGLAASLLLWIAVISLNTKSLSLALKIPIHTYFKQVPLIKVEAPEFAIDSGYNAVPLLDGLKRYFFQTPGVLPFPFPNQITNVFGGHTEIVTVGFFLSSLAFAFLLLLRGWNLYSSFSRSTLLFSLIITTISVILLHDFTYHHRQFLGSVVCLHIILAMCLSNKRRKADINI